MPEKNEALRQRLHELARREREARAAAVEIARAADALLAAAALKYGAPAAGGRVLTLPPVDVKDAGKYAVSASRSADGGYEIQVKEKTRPGQ